MHCMMGARKLNMILLSNVGNTHSKVFSLIILWWRFIQGTKEHCGGSTASVLMQANDSSHLRELSSKLSFFFPSLLWFFTVQSPHRCWNYPLKCKLHPVSPLFKILKRLSITDLRIKFSSLSRACSQLGKSVLLLATLVSCKIPNLHPTHTRSLHFSAD